MPTKFISKTLLGVLSATVLATPAFAGGNCASGDCSMAVQVMPSYAPEFGPMTVRTQQPMGHLRSVNFQRAPNVSITRIHGMMPSAGLSDVPSGFTGGCHPTSTTYCRQDAGQPVRVQMEQPVPLALYSPPAPTPVVAAPSEPRVIRIGGGYDPSKFTPRVYGDPTFVPGIAHVPTSIVDRDPVRAQQVLDTGRAVAQPVVVPGTGRVPQMVQRPAMQASMLQRPMMQAPMMQAPMMQRPTGFAPQMRGPMYGQPSFGQPSAPALQRSGPMAGAYGSSVAGDGTYWEKVSGPTAFGNTVATSVICKRQLPTRVVRPVIGVPVPVPVAVPGCGPVQPHQSHAPQGHASGRYGQPAPGRWVQ